MRKVLLGVSAIAVLAIGCETVDSDDVATDGIYAHFEINGNAAGEAHASGTLRVGGPASNTFLDLTPNDSLVAYRGADEESRAMSKSNNLGIISYHATFGVATNGTPYRIAFLRSHAEGEECNGVSAPNSTASMPMPMSITAPVGSPAYSRSTDPITITWSPSGTSDQMYWNASGPCIQPIGNTAISGDTGSYDIAPQTIVGTDTAGACTITIGLERRRDGTLDPAYGEGGTIWASQVRSVNVQSTP